ncbi:hypothetical protein A9Q84_12470 [Halobacteriovorax marinus]|uniref:Cytochrome c domain-containing protein n=1 Tax=Halobacteriovorax marinus TaxID=97084 RepID=A0A1Y5FDG1_9BACT|nr:hypothetical protein A9Q84_12470 [Halobacteriovorax marinus]
MIDHSYDGIHELNHPLPSWWMWTWSATILYSIFYFIFYHMVGGPNLTQEFEKDMIRLNEIKAIAAADVSNFDIEHYNTWKKTNDSLKIGKEVYEENCISCHAEAGGGDIGPNLTDAYWINVKERTATALFPVIRDGVEDNGMPAWGEIISKEEMYAAMAYIVSLKGTTPPEAKEAQGEKVEEF